MLCETESPRKLQELSSRKLKLSSFFWVSETYNEGQNGCCLAYIGITSNLDSNHFVLHCSRFFFGSETPAIHFQGSRASLIQGF